MVGLAMVVAMTAGMAIPALAGGWASVRLDAELGQVRAGEAVRIGFMVKGHDVEPINVEEAFLSARHRETAEEIQARAWQDGDIGHYLVDVTFPMPGEWKWEITPVPYAATSFETLTVMPAAGGAAQTDAAAHPAHIHSGTCASLGDVVYPLSDVAPDTAADAATPAAMVGAESALPVAVSETTVDAALADIAGGGHAINVHLSADEIGTYVACGDIGGQIVDDHLTIGLAELNDSGLSGIAVLTASGDQTEVTIYLAEGLSSSSETATTASSVEIEIVNSAFSPSYLEVPVGTTVTWTNKDTVPHTVSGEDLMFDDSSMLDFGKSFSQTFTEPGTHSYHCSPHPNMTGTIVVK
jgi:plastocyanin